MSDKSIQVQLTKKELDILLGGLGSYIDRARDWGDNTVDMDALFNRLAYLSDKYRPQACPVCRFKDCVGYGQFPCISA